LAYLDPSKQGLPRVQPRKRHVEYHIRREEREGFRKPFVVPTPAYEYMKYVTAYPMRFENFFYQTIPEYVDRMIAAMRDLAESKGWESVHRINMVARKVALIKDAPLISAEFYPDKRMVAEMLSEYPVNKILLYAEIARKRRLAVSWGYSKKSAIERVLQSKPLRWHEHQAVKYRRHFRELLQMVHPKPPSRELEEVWGWVVGRRPAPTPYIAAYEQVVKLASSGRYTDAVDIAISANLPWEVVRSRIGHLEAVTPEALETAARRIMSSIDVVMQYATLERVLGESKALDILASKIGWVPTPYVSRFAVNMAKLGRDTAAEVALEELRRRGPRALEDFGSMTGMAREMGGKTVALVDVSGSMSGQAIERAAMVLAGIAPVVRQVYVFNDLGVRPFSIDDRGAEWIRRLISLPSGGTPLLDSIEKVVREAMEPGETLIVLTDEQENASETATSESIAELVRQRGVNLIVVALAGYPTDFVPKQPIAPIVGVAGNDVTAFAMGIRLWELIKAQSEGISDEEFLEMMRRWIEREPAPAREPSLA